MFMIKEVFIEDKRLAEFLRICASVGVHIPTMPIPVVNVEKKNGQLREKLSGGNAPAMFLEYIKKNKISQFKRKEVNDFMESIGCKAASSNYVLKTLRAAKEIKRTGLSSSSIWNVIPNRKKKKSEIGRVISKTKILRG